MKKFAIIPIVFVLIVTLTACGSPKKLAETYNEDEVIARAKEVVDVINTLDYDAINAQLRKDLQDKLTAEQIKKGFNDKLEKAGSFKEYKNIVTLGQKSKSTGEDYAVVILICTYENSTLTYTITMDASLEIVGMYQK